MRVTFSVSDAKSVKDFFSSDVDFLDVIIISSTVYIISNTAELYSHQYFQVTSRADFKERVHFRVNRKDFLSLLSDGVVTVYLSPYGMVEITFKPVGASSYSMEVAYQACDLSSIEAKMSLLRRKEDFTAINLGSVANYLRLVREMGGMLNVVDGKIVAYKRSVQLYCSTKCEDLNMTVFAANYVLKFSDRIYGFQNYIVGTGDGLAIIACQSRSSVESDYDSIQDRGYSHSLKLSFKEICSLSKMCNVGDSIVIDFERKKAFVSDGKSNFSTTFVLKEENIESIYAKKEVTLDDFSFDLEDTVVAGSIHNIPTVEVPIEIFRNLMAGSLADAVTLKIKKKVLVFELSKTIKLVVGRKDYVA